MLEYIGHTEKTLLLVSETLYLHFRNQIWENGDVQITKGQSNKYLCSSWFETGQPVI